MNPPIELLASVEIPLVPDCQMDSCVAAWMVNEDQSLKVCASQVEAIRKWSSN